MMDDAQERQEYDLRKRLRQAVEEMDRTLMLINKNSECVAVDIESWSAFKHDEFPSDSVWGEQINEKIHILDEICGGAHRI